MSIELKHLRTLVALRDQGNLAKAAQWLHLTQSALSHQVKELEQRLGIELFHRAGRRLHLSQAGQQLLSLAERVLPQVDGVLLDLKRLAHGDHGRLHLAIECHSCVEWLMPTLDAYRQSWPGVQLDLTMAHSFNPISALLSGEVDMVITSDTTAQAALQFFPLFDYQSLLFMAESHPLAKRVFIKPTDLSSETLITYPVEQQRLDIYRYFLIPAGIKPAKLRQVELTLMILQLVASGRGVASLPNWVTQETLLQAGQLVGKPLGRRGVWARLYCGVRQPEAKIPYLSAFVAVARAVCAQHLTGIKLLAD
ncbi:MAG: LysR family transcriptional regulator [Gammaproteobacteria bacterium]|nr:LysR family transcriptional regulator [Gammaproteobacteria bacterium]